MADPDQLTVLNVDDNEAGRYARTRILMQAGFRVIEAATGAEALEIAARERPAAIVLDVNLPDISGIEVAALLRDQLELATTPILQISAQRLGDTDRVESLNRGADVYITEPVDSRVLIASIRALLRARAAEDELRRSNEQLRRFTFIVAHELQEPLRAVTSYSQLLQSRYSSRLDADAERFMGFMTDSAHRMSAFIRDLLEYSQTTDAQLEMKPVSCDALVNWALLEVQTAVSESGAVITRDPLPEVMADATRVSQVFRNLIGNAIKYRGCESPRIHLGAAAEGSHWLLSVQDNGIGIEPRYREQIFALFKRLHGRDKPGTGVGLAICKDIVERHGGRIWVESTPGSGSTFYFTLPTATGAV